MRYVLTRIIARYYQRKATYLKSKGDIWASAEAEARSELLFQRLRERNA